MAGAHLEASAPSVSMSGRDTNFYYSFLVLPAEKRRAIVAVWDFCRAVDDAVDEAPADAADGEERSARRQLARWRRELDACFGQGSVTTAQGERLAPFVARFKLPREAFDAVIDGVAMDLDCARYETFDALREHCLHVASAVGLICAEIFEYRDPRTRDYAVDLGIALQLTNIVRDVQSDLGRGRIYLPREDMVRFGCTEDVLRQGVVTLPVRDLLAFECGRARHFYEKADRELPAADRRSMVAARIMGGIYHAILERIERAGYDVFAAKIRVPRPRRAVIAATLWAQSLLGH
jgi:15-cis-phytoene synthase